MIKTGQCRNCKYFKGDSQNPEIGECFYWKKIVNFDYGCSKFAPLTAEEQPIEGEELIE